MHQLHRLEDELLVLRAQMGDDSAFTQLVERYSARLIYFVRRLLAENPAAAEDIVQDAWMIAYRQLKKLRQAEAFAAWLYGIARNATMKHQGRRFPQRIPENTELADVSDESSFTPQDAEWIHTGLDQLSIEHREVLTLRFMEDMPYEDIARVVGCGVGTVRSRLHYAKHMLKQILRSSDHG